MEQASLCRRNSTDWRTTMQLESKLIPIMREGIDIIKMIFFKKLKVYIAREHPERDPVHIGKLAGAVINDLFGTSNAGISVALFAEENKFYVDEIMGKISVEFQEMRIPLTDALRVQFLCDHQDGIDSSSILARARDLGILIMDREVPLPAHFMSLVRKLGVAFDILAPVGDAGMRGWGEK
ncbi:MAG: hypothetical protein AB2L11_09210 [Syntrophobacteraceae bacterium]